MFPYFIVENLLDFLMFLRRFKVSLYQVHRLCSLTSSSRTCSISSCFCVASRTASIRCVDCVPYFMVENLLDFLMFLRRFKDSLYQVRRLSPYFIVENLLDFLMFLRRFKDSLYQVRRRSLCIYQMPWLSPCKQSMVAGVVRGADWLQVPYGTHALLNWKAQVPCGERFLYVRVMFCRLLHPGGW